MGTSISNEILRIHNKVGKFDMINYQGDELISYLFNLGVPTLLQTSNRSRPNSFQSTRRFGCSTLDWSDFSSLQFYL
jgi:hypothetical protein